MKTLATKISKNGFLYQQLVRSQDRARNIAMYRQILLQKGMEPKVLAYEVFFVGISKAGERTLPDGTLVAFEEAEMFPSNESFGRTAWTYRSLADASKRYAQMSAQAERKEGCE